MITKDAHANLLHDASFTQNILKWSLEKGINVEVSS